MGIIKLLTAGYVFSFLLVIITGLFISFSGKVEAYDLVFGIIFIMSGIYGVYYSINIYKEIKRN